jgi:ABC-2 type transport system ATP-binding protein
MITINELLVSYEKGRHVIDGLNLQLRPKKVHGLVGLNGAGKTTLLNTIFGITKQASGSITYKNKRITKEKIAYLETENYFYPNITGIEYLNLFVNTNFDISAWNEIFELPLKNLIENYSTGMKKKLALLGVLKLDRHILILDEPFNGLDLETSKVLQMIILKLKEKQNMILITSHILESLTPICDEIHYIEKGKIKFSKKSDDFDNLSKEIFNKFSKTQLINDLIK